MPDTDELHDDLIHLELRTHWLELPDPKPPFDEYLSSSMNELLVSEIMDR